MKLIILFLLPFSLLASDQLFNLINEDIVREETIKKEIKILKKELEAYEGLGNVYVGDGSSWSNRQLDRFIRLHKEKDLIILKIQELECFVCGEM